VDISVENVANLPARGAGLIAGSQDFGKEESRGMAVSAQAGSEALAAAGNVYSMPAM
jgi:hypothetical protein